MNQLTLFEAPQPIERLCGMPPDVERKWRVAFSPEVELAVLAVVAARPGEWFGRSAFRQIIEQHDIGFCIGHALGAIARKGLMQERPVYLGKGIGAEQPGSPNYRGYTREWRAA